MVIGKLSNYAKVFIKFIKPQIVAKVIPNKNDRHRSDLMNESDYYFYIKVVPHHQGLLPEKKWLN